jgi:hypothetical protein
MVTYEFVRKYIIIDFGKMATAAAAAAAAGMAQKKV